MQTARVFSATLIILIAPATQRLKARGSANIVDADGKRGKTARRIPAANSSRTSHSEFRSKIALTTNAQLDLTVTFSN